MAERIVINTGPLIALNKGGVLGACLKLPFEFHTTAEVRAELERGTLLGKPSPDLGLICITAFPPPISPLLQAALDLGEASVIQLAVQIKAEWVCIDESLGRRFSRALGMRLTGSTGLLVMAKKHKLISEIRPTLKIMLAAGVHLSDDLIVSILKEADEGSQL